jgi:shikimate kinase
MDNQLIAITGFMAAGKTTIARALAAKLNCRFVDLDEVITSEQQRPIKEIIEIAGEDRFRDIETNTLREVLAQDEARVIALGGGGWLRPENRQILAGHDVFTVWLDTSFGLCWQRIEAGGGGRPLAGTRDQAHQLYLERRPVYELAQKRIVCDGKEAPQIVEEVVAAWQSPEP